MNPDQEAELKREAMARIEEFVDNRLTRIELFMAGARAGFERGREAAVKMYANDDFERGRQAGLEEAYECVHDHDCITFDGITLQTFLLRAIRSLKAKGGG